MRRAAFALLVLCASPAFAQVGQTSGTRTTGSMPEGSATGGTTAQGERLICRRIEGSSSRLAARRVCKTAAEWTAYDRSITEVR